MASVASGWPGGSTSASTSGWRRRQRHVSTARWYSVRRRYASLSVSTRPQLRTNRSRAAWSRSSPAARLPARRIAVPSNAPPRSATSASKPSLLFLQRTQVLLPSSQKTTARPERLPAGGERAARLSDWHWRYRIESVTLRSSSRTTKKGTQDEDHDVQGARWVV